MARAARKCEAGISPSMPPLTRQARRRNSGLAQPSALRAEGFEFVFS
jgi:hypothetical protein